jgi:lipopolysaccharide transport system permease protein
MIRNLRELWQYRALLWNLTQRELKARYRGSALGFLWTFLNPLLLMAVYGLVFGIIQRNQIQHYTYFLFVGLLPWLWFSSSVGAGASTISDRRDLLTKVRFPAQVLPATVVLTNLVNYLLTLPLAIALGGLAGIWPSWQVVMFPVVLFVQLVFTLGVSFLVSSLNVAFRDLQQIVINFLTLWFFVTPILYRPDDVPGAFRRLFLIANPMSVIITSYQGIFYEHRLPHWRALTVVTLASFLLLWLASRVFEQRREEFAELV